MGEIKCSVKEALELLSYMDEDAEVILNIDDIKTYQHIKSNRIKRKKGEELINKADSIEYQDNDFFGRLSLYGVTKEKSIVHNLLFAQLEQITKRTFESFC
ncbi:MAG: hypothetical protein IJA10_10955 [Lachnospiraceae bacterium]|nr:hypothetical protein [Lachnospiraceae bacterium]